MLGWYVSSALLVNGGSIRYFKLRPFNYLCLPALGISQIFWIKAVDEIGIGIASFHLNATPFYVMIIVYLFGSDWNWMQVLGAAILTVGTLLAQLPEKDPIHDSGVKS